MAEWGWSFLPPWEGIFSRDNSSPLYSVYNYYLHIKESKAIRIITHKM